MEFLESCQFHFGGMCVHGWLIALVVLGFFVVVLLWRSFGADDDHQMQTERWERDAEHHIDAPGKQQEEPEAR